MKKIVIFGLVLITAAAMTACSKDKEKDSRPDSVSSESREETSASSEPNIQSNEESGKEEAPSQSSSKSESSIVSKPPASSSAGESQKSPQQEIPKINSAVKKVVDSEPQSEYMFIIEKFGMEADVPWSKINKITNLDRGNMLEGDYIYYYLFVPRNNKTSVKLYSMKENDARDGLERDELVYENSSTPDDYALVINTIEPEAFYDYELEVTFEGKTELYQFSYDGRGDRPDVQIILIPL